MNQPEFEEWCMCCEDAPAADGDIYCAKCRAKKDEDGPSYD